MISTTAEITKEWLADVLRKPITQMSVRENQAFNSSVTHLDVTYTMKGARPRKVLVKLNREHDGQNEIQFYRFAEGIDLPMIPQRLCMDYDAQTGLSFLILEDISESHTAPVTRDQLKALDGVPTGDHMKFIVDCIANFHAAFWEHPQFGAIPDTTEMRWWYRDEQFHARHVERRKLEWARFVEMYKDEVPAGWLRLGESALEKLPQLFKRYIQPRLSSKQALTMSQGDCYLSQFLVPRAAPGPSYLVDFQDTCVNFPAYDLVYMLDTFWTREQRKLHEEPLLRRYQQQLNEHGVVYSWDTLRDDYRLCLSYMIFDAVWNAASGSSREYWIPKMHCLMDAYRDWRCAEL